MADFKIPNLCGASEQLNATQKQFSSVIRGLIDGIEDDASTLAANMETAITELVSNFKVMMPELPALPNINLQAQLKSLLGMTPGSAQYITLLADITLKFGSALTAAGYSLSTILKDAAKAIAGGSDICSVVPNFEVDAAGLTGAVEKAAATLHPAAEAAVEELAIFVDNVNFTEAQEAAQEIFDEYSEMGEKLLSANAGLFRVAENVRNVVAEGLNITLTTPQDSLSYENGNGLASRANVAPSGFSSQPVQITEMFNEDNVGLSEVELAAPRPLEVSFSPIITLKHKPIKIIKVEGWVIRSSRFRYGGGKKGWWPIFHQDATNNYFIDYYVLDDSKLTITGRGQNIYSASPNEAWFKVKYTYLDKIDPNFMPPYEEED